MKIRTIRPCSETAGKLIVIFELGYSLNPQKICDHLKNENGFKVILFQKYNLAWVTFEAKRILFRENGVVTVNGADNINEAEKLVKEILKVA